ncbi:MAG: hypothetical protein PF489_01910 [Salinivirgaceae bacterium]|jgi:hypothetical protein|nr:hypothetical protein [Salinivirgaceae bacterium]
MNILINNFKGYFQYVFNRKLYEQDIFMIKIFEFPNEIRLKLENPKEKINNALPKLESIYATLGVYSYLVDDIKNQFLREHTVFK